MIHVRIACFQSCQLLSLKLFFSLFWCCHRSLCRSYFAPTLLLLTFTFSASCEMNMPSFVHRFGINFISQIITVNIIRSWRNGDWGKNKTGTRPLHIGRLVCLRHFNWHDIYDANMCNDEGYSIVVTGRCTISWVWRGAGGGGARSGK